PCRTAPEIRAQGEPRGSHEESAHREDHEQLDQGEPLSVHATQGHALRSASAVNSRTTTEMAASPALSSPLSSPITVRNRSSSRARDRNTRSAALPTSSDSSDLVSTCPTSFRCALETSS